MAELRRSSALRQVELTDAALQIIATRGIAALTTRSLADAVGLSSGAIFRHFASLDALLEAIVTRVEAVLAATYPPADLPPRERLERFVEARSSTVGKQVGILRLVLSEQFLLALPKAGSERLAACVQKTRAFVLQCVRDGQQNGDFRADIDAPALAVVVLGTIQMLALAAAHPRQHKAEAPLVREALVTLLAPPAEAPRASRKRS